MSKCPKEIRAENEEELMKLAAEHAEKDHGINVSNIPPAMLQMVKAAIKDE
jgi:predicted small metal-binding protein